MFTRLAPPILIIGLALAGCRGNLADNSLSPPPLLATASIRGALVPSSDDVNVIDRGVALCQVMAADDARQALSPCRLIGPSVRTDAQGRFAFEGLAPGVYLIVYESGLGEFEAAMERWSGQELRPGEWAWIRSEYLALPEGAYVNVRLPKSLPANLALDLAAYGLQTLLFDGSPFVIAHEVHRVGNSAAADPLSVEAAPGEAFHLILPAFDPAPIRYGAIREQIGALSRDESALFDRDLTARWQRFVEGDDAAFLDTDLRAIEALRSGDVYPIGNALITSVEEHNGELIKRVGYLTIDVQSGEQQVIGWLDETTGDVFEASTGYFLNVRDAPGVWIQRGPDGEQFYHYGFSYYRRWGQILPDPMITLIEDFYTRGLAFFWGRMADFQAAARSFGGDMRLVTWDNRTRDQIQAWQPSTPPFVHFPDSGTVDVRRERFLQALIDGQVTIDEQSLQQFLASDIALNGAFNQMPDPQEVRDALLIPYRSGHLFSDLEAAIILDATYGGRGPLTIRISAALQQGFLVPDNGTGNELLVAQNEVANVLLGYPGALNSRWAHEMGHIVDFRAPQYTFRGRPLSGSRCEPAKYLMEYMWWVHRYPGDAPDWDWVPINSGLTLARLLTEQFHNSGC